MITFKCYLKKFGAEAGSPTDKQSPLWASITFPGAGVEQLSDSRSLLSPEASLCPSRPQLSPQHMLLATYSTCWLAAEGPQSDGLTFHSSVFRIINSAPENSKERAQMTMDGGDPGGQCLLSQAPFSPDRCTHVVSAGQGVTTVNCHHQISDARGL